MNNKERDHSFRMPMIELILVIGIFSIISVFLVQMFLTAEKLRSGAVDISRAVVTVESAAEIIRGSSSAKEAAVRMDLTNKSSDSEYIGFFDDNWVSSTEESAYTLSVKVTTDQGKNGIMEKSEIVVYDTKMSKKIESDKELCKIEISCYRKNK